MLLKLKDKFVGSGDFRQKIPMYILGTIMAVTGMRDYG